MVNEKVPFSKNYLLTAIHESWNHFDKEHCFKLLKYMPERIKTVIKA